MAAQRPTRKWAEKTLRRWQHALGLSHWEIDLDWDTIAPEDCFARTWRANDYDLACVWFPKAWRERSREEVEQTIVHELVHLVLRDAAQAHRLVCDQLPKRAQELAGRYWTNREEQAVDRLAHAFVRVAREAG